MVDPDIGNNSLLTYSIDSPFIYSSSDLRNDFEDDPFTIGSADGIIRTNAYFEDDQEGFIQFVVKVVDPNPSFFDRVNISVSWNMFEMSAYVFNIKWMFDCGISLAICLMVDS